MEVDYLVRSLIVGLVAFGFFLGWLVLLAGESAIQRVCPGNCRELTGLTWWIIWFQLLVYAFSLPVQFGKLDVAKSPILFGLAILATLETLQANRFLDLKDAATFGHTPRINTVVAGHSILAAFNILTILFLGFITYDDLSVPPPQDHTPHHTHLPTPPAIPGAHPMKPMTSRASSFRASSPAASELSYPAVPGR